jgi:ADP-ribose pyrophosphatase YjhB (NUDIX family)
VKQSVAILIRQSGKYVLQQRNDNPAIIFPGMVTPWGGLVEKEDKSIEYAAARELLEETGVEVKIEELVLVSKYAVNDINKENSSEEIMINVFFIELSDDVEIQCLEGNKLFFAESIQEIPNFKRTEFLIKVVEAYEQTR